MPLSRHTPSSRLHPRTLSGIGSWEVVSSYSSATAPDLHGISCADPLSLSSQRTTFDGGTRAVVSTHIKAPTARRPPFQLAAFFFLFEVFFFFVWVLCFSLFCFVS